MGAVDPAQLVAVMDVAVVVVEHAVAVEEGRRPAQDGRHEALRTLEIVGNADIDEGRLDDGPLDQPFGGQLREDVAFQRAGQGGDA